MAVESFGEGIIEIRTVLFGATGGAGLVKQVSDVSSKMDKNRSDLYNSLEGLKTRITESEKVIVSMQSTISTMKWTIGLGLSLVGIALAILRML